MDSQSNTQNLARGERILSIAIASQKLIIQKRKGRSVGEDRPKQTRQEKEKPFTKQEKSKSLKQLLSIC